MTKKNILSANEANRLYWLGRYEERVYVALHLLRKCYDKMIDGQQSDYYHFWEKFNVENIYASNEEFEYGMLYDENNINSIAFSQRRAMDNAMELRNDITSETLSYIEMSIAKIKELKGNKETNITTLQPITDWALAFFGSAHQRIENNMVLSTIFAGRIVEYLDAMIRFDYPIERLRFAFEGLNDYTDKIPGLTDNDALLNAKALLDNNMPGDAVIDADTKNKLMFNVNRIICA